MTNDALIELLRKPCDEPGCGHCRLELQAADVIERLQAIVGRLPKTADGVSIVPGDVLHHVLDDVHWQAVAVLCLSESDDQGAPLSLLTFDRWFSTNEAAEKARTA